MATAKNTICLWFNKDAEDAARFYSTTFRKESLIRCQAKVLGVCDDE